MSAGPDTDGPARPERCECRCDLWAHALYRVCEQDDAQQTVSAEFETAQGLEWRRLCGPCWDHVRFARQSNGERVASDLAQMS